MLISFTFTLGHASVVVFVEYGESWFAHAPGFTYGFTNFRVGVLAGSFAGTGALVPSLVCWTFCCMLQRGKQIRGSHRNWSNRAIFSLLDILLYVVEGEIDQGESQEVEQSCHFWSAGHFAECCRGGKQIRGYVGTRASSQERGLYYEKLVSEQVLSGHYITFVAYLFHWTLCCMLESMIVQDELLHVMQLKVAMPSCGKM